MSVATASCLLVDQQAIELSRGELRAAVRRAMAQATISSGAGSPSLDAAGASLNVEPDSFTSRFESVSPGNSDNSVRVAGRALLLGAAGGLYDAVLVGADEVDAWISAMRESANCPGVGPVVLDGVVPEGGAACAPEFTVWIAAGQKGLDQAYKPLCIYAEEAAPTPKPPPACGVPKGLLRALQMDSRAPALGRCRSLPVPGVFRVASGC